MLHLTDLVAGLSPADLRAWLEVFDPLWKFLATVASALLARWYLRMQDKATLVADVTAAVGDAVAAVDQTFVEPRKDPALPLAGDWDLAAQSQARAAALIKVRTRIPALDARLRAHGLVPDAVLATMLEAAVRRLHVAVAPVAPAAPSSPVVEN